ncbi:MAG TPA: gephyrin-like molybdotransferase receptor GlpR [Actinophytocola sp.]|nr:gephyrin-like molybdotransferase receptor GlpR [Actinophytocola sp.]
MPSSLVVVALVLAWLVVLVPMIVRKRQEVAKTADSELAARVVRSGSGEAEDGAEYGDEEAAMRDTDDIDEDEFGDDRPESHDGVHDGAPVDENDVDDAPEDAAHDADGEDMTGYYDEADLEYSRRYRPGRGGFDPEAAAIIARAKYAFRQRVVLAMIIGAVATAVVAGVAFPMLWWGHGALDVVLVSYLVYLRRQVRIETEIRERRLARLQRVRRAQAAAARSRPAEQYAPPPAYAPVTEEPEAYEDYEDEQAYGQAYEDPYEPYDPEQAHGPRERVVDGPSRPPVTRSGAVLVDVDDEDPTFDELGEPGSLPYRRAVGE